jgi:hypothetical protein
MRPDTGCAKIPGGQEYKEFSKIDWAGHRNAHPHQVESSTWTAISLVYRTGKFSRRAGKFFDGAGSDSAIGGPIREMAGNREASRARYRPQRFGVSESGFQPWAAR